MSIVNKFASLTFEGQYYRFDHLAPFVFTLNGQAREGGDIRVRVSFQSHVFSPRSEANEQCHLVDQSGAPRVFCVNRYAKSLTLPDFCRRMLAENMLTWESYDKNRISNMAEMEGTLTSGEHHVAVYYLFPSQASGVEVEMVIKSAYRKVLNFDNIKRGSTSFSSQKNATMTR